MERPKPKAPKIEPLIVVRTKIIDPSTGRFLLCKRAKTGEWELPGGKIDPLESLDAAAHREIGEETNAVINLTSPFRIYERIILGPKPGKEHLEGMLRIGHVATAELVCDPAVLQPNPDEVADMKWHCPGQPLNLPLRREMPNILAVAARLELQQIALAA